MFKVKGIVLQQHGRRITVFTENGEFKSYWHRGRAREGQEVAKWDYGVLAVCAVTVLLLFALAVAVFYYLLTATSI